MVNDFRFQYAMRPTKLGPSGFPDLTDIGKYPAERLAQLQTVYIFPGFPYGQGLRELGIETPGS